MASRCEYKIVPESEMSAGADESAAERLGDQLNELGEHGWELVVVRSQPDGEDLWVFKRPASPFLKATDEVAASLQRLIDTGRAVASRKPGAAAGPVKAAEPAADPETAEPSKSAKSTASAGAPTSLETPAPAGG